MKTFNLQQNVGKAKYVVNHHDGVKQHRDESPFFDINIFKNKRKLIKFTKELTENGYQESHA